MHEFFTRGIPSLPDVSVNCIHDNEWSVRFCSADLDDGPVCTPVFLAEAWVIDRNGDAAIQCFVRHSDESSWFVEAPETKTFFEFAEMLEDISWAAWVEESCLVHELKPLRVKARVSRVDPSFVW